MHIPDGYLSPASAGILYGVMIPFWYTASRKVRTLFSGSTAPVMALMSAFCFVIQMLNVPLPGGTTGHAAGASLAAIVLGPWPAVLSISIALVIQAFFFGDGGITAIGANCFNIAVVQVFVTYYIYSIITFGLTRGKGRIIGAGIAAYFGLLTASLLAGLELGLQPVISSNSAGVPLYAPYPLSVTIPAMFLGHLAAGIAEAVVTVAGIAFLQRTAPELLSVNPKNQEHAQQNPKMVLAWAILCIIIFLTPLGLLAPGTAWGEWSSDQLRDLGLGFIPVGMQKWERFWNGLFPDYSIPGTGENIGYILSAILGATLILLTFALLSLLRRKPAQQ